MGLDIYIKENEQFFAISTDSLLNPVTTVHDGKTGDTVTLQLYIRNDDALKWFSSIRVFPLDTEDANPYGDVNHSETGWGIKLSPGADEPTFGEWEDLHWGDTIAMSNIGADSSPDTTTYFPFWYYITCPPNTDAKTKTDILLRAEYTENAT